MKKNDNSILEVKFGGENEPKDDKLIDLLKMAYNGEMLVRMAIIKAEGIKPFSSFKPKTSSEFRNYFNEMENEGTLLPIYVYPFGVYFIMSDDYNSYFLYKEKNYSQIPCVLLGDSESEYIVEKSEPFLLPPPTAQVIN